jgi:hypothetical protein
MRVARHDSSTTQSAINDNFSAINEAILDQKNSGISDLINMPKPPQRRRLQRLLPSQLRHAGGHIRLDIPGHDHIRPDAARAQLRRQRARQPHNSRLGRRIHAGPGHGLVQAQQRGDVDDAPAFAPPEHILGHGAASQRGAQQVRAQHLVDDAGARGYQQGLVRDARRVD